MEGWVLLTDLGTSLQQIQPGFQPKLYGHMTLSKLLESMPDFLEIHQNGTGKATRLKNIKRSKPSKMPPVQRLISSAMAKATQDSDGWVLLSHLGGVLRQLQPNFTSKNYGHTNLTKLLQSMPDFVELRTKEGAKSARLKHRS